MELVSWQAHGPDADGQLRKAVKQKDSNKIYFSSYSKIIYIYFGVFYEVQRILELFHSSGVFPASGGRKKKILLGEEVFLTWCQGSLDGMLMLWGGSLHASLPLLGVKGQDLCLLYAGILETRT